MVKFQTDVKTIPKTKINPFFSKNGTISKYADLAGVIETCKPVLNKHGLVVIQTMAVVDGKNHLRTTLADTSGESMVSDMLLPDIADPQKLTAAVTYLRRCQYLAIVGLVADEDDDGNSVGHQQEENRHSGNEYNKQAPRQDKPAGDKPASDKQKNLVKMLVEQTGVNVTQDQINALTFKSASAWIEKLNKMKAEQGTSRGPEIKADDIPW